MKTTSECIASLKTDADTIRVSANQFEPGSKQYENIKNKHDIYLTVIAQLIASQKMAKALQPFAKSVNRTPNSPYFIADEKHERAIKALADYREAGGQ